jgi:hypothetical protein
MTTENGVVTDPIEIVVKESLIKYAWSPSPFSRFTQLMFPHLQDERAYRAQKLSAGHTEPSEILGTAASRLTETKHYYCHL